MSGPTYIHSITTSRLFTGVSFSECPEESVGQSIFAEVCKDFVINFESSKVGCGWMSDRMLYYCSEKLTRSSNCLLRESLDRGSFVTGSVDELVVDDLDGTIVR